MTAAMTPRTEERDPGRVVCPGCKAQGGHRHLEQLRAMYAGIGATFERWECRHCCRRFTWSPNDADHEGSVGRYRDGCRCRPCRSAWNFDGGDHERPYAPRRP